MKYLIQVFLGIFMLKILCCASETLANDTIKNESSPPAPQKNAPKQLPAEKLPPLDDEIQPHAPPKPLPLPPEKRVGFAIVGLGKLSLEEILPAFSECSLAKVTALMTGDKKKGQRIASSYGIDENAIYSYEEWGRLKNDENVQAVYIVTPNSLHKDMVIQAADIGKHILCEKPMAINSQEAQEMIEACKKANVKLMIAYRCQYEEHHLAALEIAKKGSLGKLISIEAHNGQNQDNSDQWRHQIKMAGGGALPDVGIYCLNFARFITQEEPTSVLASISTPKNDARFKEVEANVFWQMNFPSEVTAQLSTSYNSYEARTATLHFEKGTLLLSPAFAYNGNKLKVIHRDPEKSAINVEKELVFFYQNQFTTEIDYMAHCILSNLTPKTSGEEGLKDQIIMEAIYNSAKENQLTKVFQPAH